MEPENLVEVFMLAKQSSLMALVVLIESAPDEISRKELKEYADETMDMYDMKIECLKLRAALV